MNLSSMISQGLGTSALGMECGPSVLSTWPLVISPGRTPSPQTTLWALLFTLWMFLSGWEVLVKHPLLLPGAQGNVLNITTRLQIYHNIECIYKAISPWALLQPEYMLCDWFCFVFLPLAKHILFRLGEFHTPPLLTKTSTAILFPPPIFMLNAHVQTTTYQVYPLECVKECVEWNYYCSAPQIWSLAANCSLPGSLGDGTAEHTKTGNRNTC